MRRWSADDRAFSAWLICLMPSGPVALTFTAWLRAWITASSVERSNSIAPLTAFTRLGIRSWRRLSWTSICLKALSVWFLREMSPLYAPISQRTTAMRTANRIQENISTLRSWWRFVEDVCGGWWRMVEDGDGFPPPTSTTSTVLHQPSLGRRRHQFRERLPHGLGDRRIIGAEARQGVSRLDMQLHAPAHGDAVPGARALGVPRGVPRQPRRQRPARLAARRRALALERQPVRHGQGGTQRLGRAAFQHVTGLVVHLLDDRRQRRPLHLPQFDPQELQEMSVGIRSGGAATFGWAHETLGDVEPDRALTRLRPCGGVDRGDRGRIEHGSHERGEIPEVPRGEVAVLPQVLQGLGVRRSGHAPAPPRARSSSIRNTPVSQSVSSRRLNGFRITTHWCRSSQVRTSSASAFPVMIAMRPSNAGQRCTMARYRASPDIVGRWMSSSRASGCTVASRSYAVSALPAPITRRPWRASERSSTRRNGASSSTTRMVRGAVLMRRTPAPDGASESAGLLAPAPRSSRGTSAFR